MLLKRYTDGAELHFVRGYKDEWKVVIRPKVTRVEGPTDEELLTFFQHFGQPAETWQLVQQIAAQVSNTVVDLSNYRHPQDFLSNFHPPIKEPLLAEKLCDAYAACLIAEEQKRPYGQPSKLGKRIKLLGAYQVLFENKTPLEAAKFSFGVSWRTIDELCRARGF